MAMRQWRLMVAIVTGLIALGGSTARAQGLGPNGATAKCQDGEYSHNKIQGMACRDHNGLEVWYGLAQNEAVAAQKRADVYAVLEAALGKEQPNIIARADLAGTIQDRFTADSADVAQNPSFMVYLDRVRQLSGCRKMSNHCALCPGAHQIYCTNIAAFLPLMAF
ncbi:MAG TPA: hypothetical protein VL563_14955 [Gemmatimonadales bacterium]|jgi:hypothetical protein|nr:hypothetical protein [Gemmatimonadales bacterium]